MSALFTPLLAEGRQAQLDLGVNGWADCRIAGFAGQDVFLQLDDGIFAAGDRLGGYLLLEDGDQMQALRGSVKRGSDAGSAVMRLTDRFAGQRRLFSRAPLALRAQVRGPSEWSTYTRDVSAGGARIARRPDWDGEERLELTLALADDVRIVVEAEVLRVSADDLGLRFTRIEPRDAALLAELTLAFHSR